MEPRIVFMGSPEFAVPTLQRLSEKYTVAGVVSQPDQPAGRGRIITPPPVKVLAESLNLPFIQPASLKEEDAFEKLSQWKPDLIVVVAFGQILRKRVLELPPWGCLNVHASLLPRWRGAAPIQAAILAGDQETGVTIMKLDKGVDTGPILAQRSVKIHLEDTALSLGEKLSKVGADLLMEVLPGYMDESILPVPQNDAGSTYAAMITKEQGNLDFFQPVEELARQVRAYYPWPGTSMPFKNNQLKILKAHPLHDSSSQPGLRSVIEDYPAVGGHAGWLVLDVVQPAGKKPMTGRQFLLGARDWTT